jgi:hypothetical protein
MSTLELKELSHPAGEVIKIAAGKTLDLKSQGSVTMPTGSVLQVLIADDSVGLTTSSTSYIDVGLSLTITPKSTSSKILCLWNAHGFLSAVGAGFGSRLVRGSTTVFTTATNYYVYGGSANSSRQTGEFKHLDSPNTASAVTYKVQVQPHNSTQVQFNANGLTSQLVLMEIQG